MFDSRKLWVNRCSCSRRAFIQGYLIEFFDNLRLLLEYFDGFPGPMLRRSDIDFLLENTDFDEYDIREWFREFLKVM